MEEKNVTPLVIHNANRASVLVNILRDHGIAATTVPVADTELVQVVVPARDVAFAVKIMECSPGYSASLVELQLAGMSGNLLIPVDFSPYSMLACKVGFELAQRLALHPLLLHTYMDPVPLSDNSMNDYGNMVPEQDLDMEVTMDRQLENEAWIQMRKFAAKLRQARLDGDVANVKFSTMIRCGLPEEVIKNYAKDYKPAVIVMATRGKNKKHSDLIGSVTAEVIDSCRVPVFTVPENYDFPGIREIKKLGVFCNMEPTDILSMDALMTMFNYPEVDVTLFPVSDKNPGRLPERLSYLTEYFSNQFPIAKFDYAVISQKTFRKEIEDYLSEHNVELLIIPNKKKNIFGRLFNPGIAHRILFEKDIPMLVLPIK